MHVLTVCWNCPNCGSLNTYDVDTIVNASRPAINWDFAACESFYCDECDNTFVTGDFEMFHEDDI